MSKRPTDVYRIVVTKWPTPDGQPWPRFVLPEPVAWMPRCSLADHPWLAALVETHAALVESEFEKFHEAQNGEYVTDGWLLPGKPRPTYVSRYAAEEWVRRALFLGAEAHIETGRIAWESSE